MSTLEEIKENAIILRRFNEYGQERYVNYPWYSKIEFNEAYNTFSFKFNQDIAELLLKLKENGIGYYKSYFKEYLYLKSVHASKLYEILRAEEYTNPKRKYPLESLKEKLNLNKKSSYDDWDFFKRNILTKSIDQLNRNTNYIFSFDIERVGRRVGFVIFQVFEKKRVKELSKYISKKMEEHFNKQQPAIKALFESQKLNQLLYYYDPMKDHLTLSLENTRIQSREQIEPLQSLFSEISVHKKVLSNIFRKGTALSFKLSVTPWEEFAGENKRIFDRLREKCQLSPEQAYAVIIQYDLSEIREKLKEKLVFHQRGVLKKYEWDKGMINPIQNVAEYVYTQLFKMKQTTAL